MRLDMLSRVDLVFVPDFETARTERTVEPLRGGSVRLCRDLQLSGCRRIIDDCEAESDFGRWSLTSRVFKLSGPKLNELSS